MATKSFIFSKGDPDVDGRTEANVLQGEIYTGCGDPPLVTLNGTSVNPQAGTTVFAWIVTHENGYGGQDTGVHVKVIFPRNVNDRESVAFALYQDGLDPADALFPWPLS